MLNEIDHVEVPIAGEAVCFVVFGVVLYRGSFIVVLEASSEPRPIHLQKLRHGHALGPCNVGPGDVVWHMHLWSAKCDILIEECDPLHLVVDRAVDVDVVHLELE